ncbi:MAG: 50S ribosomal protein L18 [Tissierellia bacterium]|jgi:large subunit ribosomal protein L18|nr:50S ribosomal protein L18 [Tissierellia bacterium]
MVKQFVRNDARKKRHQRVRSKIHGTNERPRLCIFRSNKNIYAQIIDDVAGNTLVSASSLEGNLENTSNKAAARAVGELIADKALEKGITKVVFDRAGYLYHGRVKELAEGARDKGLEF